MGLNPALLTAPAAADTCWGTVISRTTLIKQVAQFNPKGVQCHRGPKVGTAERLQNGMFPEPRRQIGSDLQMEKLAKGSLSQDGWLSPTPAPHPLHEKAPQQKEISTHQPWTEQTRQCARAGGGHRAERTVAEDITESCTGTATPLLPGEGLQEDALSLYQCFPNLGAGMGPCTVLNWASCYLV